MRLLATVELQLIFQFCTQRSLHAASAPVAWAALPCISVSTLQPQLQQSIARSLLRFSSAGVHVRLLHPLVADQDESRDLASEWLTALEGVAPITELTSSGYRPIYFSCLLENPMFKALRVLRIQNPIIDIHAPDQYIPAIEEMRLVGACSLALLDALPRLSRLRTLHCSLQYHGLAESHAEALSRCVQTTTLSFDQMFIRSLPSVLLRSTMSVTELIIQCKYVDDPIGVGSLRCLSFAPHLRTVTFLRCFHPAAVIRALSKELLPQGPLRRLIINPMEQINRSVDVPSSDLVRDFVSKLPLVELHFELWFVVPRHPGQNLQRPGPNDRFLARSRGMDAFVSSWTHHQSMLSAMKTACEQLVASSPRVTLCLPSPGEAPMEERDRDTRAYYIDLATAPREVLCSEAGTTQPASCCSIC